VAVAILDMLITQLPEHVEKDALLTVQEVVHLLDFRCVILVMLDMVKKLQLLLHLTALAKLVVLIAMHQEIVILMEQENVTHANQDLL
jgi:hypothetical protein